MRLTPCALCGHEFDQAAAGPMGCPNCLGEGLDDGPPVGGSETDTAVRWLLAHPRRWVSSAELSGEAGVSAGGLATRLRPRESLGQIRCVMRAGLLYWAAATPEPSVQELDDMLRAQRAEQVMRKAERAAQLRMEVSDQVIERVVRRVVPAMPGVSLFGPLAVATSSDLRVSAWPSGHALIRRGDTQLVLSPADVLAVLDAVTTPTMEAAGEAAA